ncbi:hypothetical protein C5167_047319 [Papaver somniferum]|uniref:Uncharacterized protein n=1 Tax=Papaver somniferum TaxID=3469 RepID=A0A4Y7LIK4_PAPSO|nr:hypothetical protein C5167_047319 [Papaver somniferum]
MAKSQRHSGHNNNLKHSEIEKGLTRYIDVSGLDRLEYSKQEKEEKKELLKELFYNSDEDDKRVYVEKQAKPQHVKRQKQTGPKTKIHISNLDASGLRLKKIKIAAVGEGVDAGENVD